MYELDPEKPQDEQYAEGGGYMGAYRPEDAEKAPKGDPLGVEGGKWAPNPEHPAHGGDPHAHGGLEFKVVEPARHLIEHKGGLHHPLSPNLPGAKDPVSTPEEYYKKHPFTKHFDNHTVPSIDEIKQHHVGPHFSGVIGHRNLSGLLSQAHQAAIGNPHPLFKFDKNKQRVPAESQSADVFANTQKLMAADPTMAGMDVQRSNLPAFHDHIAGIIQQAWQQSVPKWQKQAKWDAFNKAMWGEPRVSGRAIGRMMDETFALNYSDQATVDNLSKHIEANPDDSHARDVRLDAMEEMGHPHAEIGRHIRNNTMPERGEVERFVKHHFEQDYRPHLEDPHTTAYMGVGHPAKKALRSMVREHTDPDMLHAPQWTSMWDNVIRTTGHDVVGFRGQGPRKYNHNPKPSEQEIETKLQEATDRLHQGFADHISQIQRTVHKRYSYMFNTPVEDQADSLAFAVDMMQSYGLSDFVTNKRPLLGHASRRTVPEHQEILDHMVTPHMTGPQTTMHRDWESLLHSAQSKAAGNPDRQFRFLQSPDGVMQREHQPTFDNELHLAMVDAVRNEPVLNKVNVSKHGIEQHHNRIAQTIRNAWATVAGRWQGQYGGNMEINLEERFYGVWDKITGFFGGSGGQGEGSSGGTSRPSMANDPIHKHMHAGTVPSVSEILEHHVDRHHFGEGNQPRHAEMEHHLDDRLKHHLVNEGQYGRWKNVDNYREALPKIKAGKFAGQNVQAFQNQLSSSVGMSLLAVDPVMNPDLDLSNVNPQAKYTPEGGVGPWRQSIAFHIQRGWQKLFDDGWGKYFNKGSDGAGPDQGPRPTRPKPTPEPTGAKVRETEFATRMQGSEPTARYILDEQVEGGSHIQAGLRKAFSKGRNLHVEGYGDLYSHYAEARRCLSPGIDVEGYGHLPFDDTIWPDSPIHVVRDDEHGIGHQSGVPEAPARPGQLESEAGVQPLGQEAVPTQPACPEGSEVMRALWGGFCYDEPDMPAQAMPGPGQSIAKFQHSDYHPRSGVRFHQANREARELPKFNNMSEYAEHITSHNKPLGKIPDGHEDYHPAHVAELGKSVSDEIRHVLGHGGKSALHWYGHDIQKMWKHMGEIHPELHESHPEHKQHRSLFASLLAATSNNQAPSTQFDQVAHPVSGLYRNIVDKGEVPKGFKAGGTSAHTIKSHANAINEMVKAGGGGSQGIGQLHDFLHTPYKVHELHNKGYLVTGEDPNLDVHGGHFMGPKLGSFFQNVMGNFDPTTMDKWFTRTMRRHAGTWDEPNLGVISKHAGEMGRMMPDLADTAFESKAQRRTVQKQLQGLEQDPKKLARGENEVSDWLRKHYRTFANADFKSEPGEEHFDKQTKKMVQAHEALNDDPGNRHSRNFFRDVMHYARQDLKNVDNIDIPNANAQAAVWYPEKKLAAIHGIGGKGAMMSSYGDEASTANARWKAQQSYMLAPDHDIDWGWPQMDADDHPDQQESDDWWEGLGDAEIRQLAERVMNDHRAKRHGDLWGMAGDSNYAEPMCYAKDPLQEHLANNTLPGIHEVSDHKLMHGATEYALDHTALKGHMHQHLGQSDEVSHIADHAHKYMQNLTTLEDRSQGRTKPDIVIAALHYGWKDMLAHKYAREQHPQWTKGAEWHPNDDPMKHAGYAYAHGRAMQHFDAGISPFWPDGPDEDFKPPSTGFKPPDDWDPSDPKGGGDDWGGGGGSKPPKPVPTPLGMTMADDGYVLAYAEPMCYEEKNPLDEHLANGTLPSHDEILQHHVEPHFQKSGYTRFAPHIRDSLIHDFQAPAYTLGISNGAIDSMVEHQNKGGMLDIYNVVPHAEQDLGQHHAAIAHHIRNGWADMLGTKHAQQHAPVGGLLGNPNFAQNTERFKQTKAAYKHHLLHGQQQQQEHQFFPEDHYADLVPGGPGDLGGPTGGSGEYTDDLKHHLEQNTLPDLRQIHGHRLMMGAVAHLGQGDTNSFREHMGNMLGHVNEVDHISDHVAKNSGMAKGGFEPSHNPDQVAVHIHNAWKDMLGHKYARSQSRASATSLAPLNDPSYKQAFDRGMIAMDRQASSDIGQQQDQYALTDGEAEYAFFGQTPFGAEGPLHEHLRQGSLPSTGEILQHHVGRAYPQMPIHTAEPTAAQQADPQYGGWKRSLDLEKHVERTLGAHLGSGHDIAHHTKRSIFEANQRGGGLGLDPHDLGQEHSDHHAQQASIAHHIRRGWAGMIGAQMAAPIAKVGGEFTAVVPQGDKFNLQQFTKKLYPGNLLGYEPGKVISSHDNEHEAGNMSATTGLPYLHRGPVASPEDQQQHQYWTEQAQKRLLGEPLEPPGGFGNPGEIDPDWRGGEGPPAPKTPPPRPEGTKAPTRETEFATRMSDNESMKIYALDPGD